MTSQKNVIVDQYCAIKGLMAFADLPLLALSTGGYPLDQVQEAVCLLGDTKSEYRVTSDTIDDYLENGWVEVTREHYEDVLVICLAKDGDEIAVVDYGEARMVAEI